MKRLIKSVIGGDTHPLWLLQHRLRSEYAAAKARYPAKKLRVICVTGTDGKTTTVAMISHILKACGKKAGAVSTAFFEVDGVRKPNPTQKTSVSSARLQPLLRRLVREKCEFAVVEVSSHGLMQSRLAGVRPEVAAVTNVTMEHLDYHGTMEEYIRAKGRLFTAMKGRGTKVLNADDVSFAAYSRLPSANTAVWSPLKDIVLLTADPESSVADVTVNGTVHRLTLHVPGTFNLRNALCAIHCTVAAGIPAAEAVKALAGFPGTPGRMERVDAGQDFSVFLDFTVTPVAYESTLASARTLLKPGNRLLVLTGSCGDRMPEKRPLVGEVCTRLADVTVITNEDPYTEDPEKIIDEVLSGVPGHVRVFRSTGEVPIPRPDTFCLRLSDRLEAIRFLLREAKKGDVVLFCGKGADITMMIGTTQVPWNEKKIVTDELRSLAA